MDVISAVGVVTGYGQWVVDLLDYLRHADVSLLYLYMYFFASSSLIFVNIFSKLIFMLVTYYTNSNT